MNIEAIVYTSNTGNTEQYAKMLAARTGLTVYSAKDAETAYMLTRSANTCGGRERVILPS